MGLRIRKIAVRAALSSLFWDLMCGTLAMISLPHGMAEDAFLVGYWVNIAAVVDEDAQRRLNHVMRLAWRT